MIMSLIMILNEIGINWDEYRDHGIRSKLN